MVSCFESLILQVFATAARQLARSPPASLHGRKHDRASEVVAVSLVKRFSCTERFLGSFCRYSGRREQ